MDILNDVLDFARAGFAEVNALQGLIIALITALVMTEWKRLPFFVLGAVVVHILVDVLAPVFANGAAFRLPDFLELYFWKQVGLLLVGYLVIISILVLIRRLVLKR